MEWTYFIIILFLLSATFFWKVKNKELPNVKNLANGFLLIVLLILSVFLTMNEDNMVPSIISSYAALLFFVLLVIVPPYIYVLFEQLLAANFEKFHRHFYISGILFITNTLSFFYLLFVDPERKYFFPFTKEMLYTVNITIVMFVFPVSVVFYWLKVFRLLKNIEFEWRPKKRLFYNLFFAYTLLLISFLLQLVYRARLEVGFFYFCIGYMLFSIVLLGVQNKHYITKDFELLDDNDNDELLLFKRIEDNLEPALIAQKLHLNPRFTLKQCARSIGTNEKLLSAYLNKVHQMNFNTYINGFRIETAKALLHSDDADKYTIEAIAKMAGFNTKSSFNSVFKKYTGITPSEFKLRKQHPNN